MPSLSQNLTVEALGFGSGIQKPTGPAAWYGVLASLSLQGFNADMAEKFQKRILRAWFPEPEIPKVSRLICDVGVEGSSTLRPFRI